MEPAAVAVDGSGDVWYVTLNDATLRELVGASVPVLTPIAVATSNHQLGPRP